MDLGLAGQRVVVVGAAGGIGRAVASRFHGERGQVVWVDRDSRVHDHARQVDVDAATEGRVFTVDATDYPAVQHVAAHISSSLGRCDHVVVSVGVGSGKLGFPFWNLSPSDWTPVLDGNLMSVVNTVYAFVPHMLSGEHGTLTLLSSVAGQIGSQTDPPYSAAKAAVINFVQCAAKDLAAYGIRVNAVSPGMVKTDINRQVWQSWRAASVDHQLDYDQWAESKIRDVAPLGRWQTADEVAGAIAFLASDLARNITGQTLNVDGGQVMHA